MLELFDIQYEDALMGLQVFHFHTTGYEIDMKQKKVWKKYVFNKKREWKNFCLVQIKRCKS